MGRLEKRIFRFRNTRPQDSSTNRSHSSSSMHSRFLATRHPNRRSLISLNRNQRATMFKVRDLTISEISRTSRLLINRELSKVTLNTSNQQARHTRPISMTAHPQNSQICHPLEGQETTQKVLGKATLRSKAVYSNRTNRTSIANPSPKTHLLLLPIDFQRQETTRMMELLKREPQLPQIMILPDPTQPSLLTACLELQCPISSSPNLPIQRYCIGLSQEPKTSTTSLQILQTAPKSKR